MNWVVLELDPGKWVDPGPKAGVTPPGLVENNALNIDTNHFSSKCKSFPLKKSNCYYFINLFIYNSSIALSIFFKKVLLHKNIINFSEARCISCIRKKWDLHFSCVTDFFPTIYKFEKVKQVIWSVDYKY